jgi:hypothetical protein
LALFVVPLVALVVVLDVDVTVDAVSVDVDPVDVVSVDVTTNVVSVNLDFKQLKQSVQTLTFFICYKLSSKILNIIHYT